LSLELVQQGVDLALFDRPDDGDTLAGSDLFMEVVAVHRLLMQQSKQDVFVGEGDGWTRRHNRSSYIHDMNIEGVMIPQSG
jgi:hypothetical protein